MILFDNSWHGCGGIGRFSDSISSRLSISSEIEKVNNGRHPTKFSSMVFSSVLLIVKSFFCNGECLYFTPGFIPPLFVLKRFKYVLTMHDLNHVYRDENSGLLKRFFYKYIILPRCKGAEYILTVSEFSKRQIADWSGVSEDKIINVGNGVDASYTNNVERFYPGYPYLFVVGNRKVHKNEERLLRAFSVSDINQDIKIIFSGVESEALAIVIDELGISNRVVFLGQLSEELLPMVYAGSLGLLFPSLYEGFGLPVIEAMACGIPVLTSNTTSLPEVAGDAALLVSPDSVDSIRIGIERLVSDSDLRCELIDRGLARAKLFSWDVVAQSVKRVLDEVISNDS